MQACGDGQPRGSCQDDWHVSRETLCRLRYPAEGCKGFVFRSGVCGDVLALLIAVGGCRGRYHDEDVRPLSSAPVRPVASSKVSRETHRTRALLELVAFRVCPARWPTLRERSSRPSRWVRAVVLYAPWRRQLFRPMRIGRTWAAPHRAFPVKPGVVHDRDGDGDGDGNGDGDVNGNGDGNGSGGASGSRWLKPGFGGHGAESQ